MKEFGKMTNQEFHKASRFASLAILSRWAVFSQRTKYWRFERKDGTIEPKWSVFENHKYLPHQLDLLEAGEHPNYIIWSE
jgi:hypothetical protein